MNVEFFVWYGVAGDPLATRVAVDAMMTDVADRTGISGRLLVRHDKPDTWMEIYESVTDPVAFEREITTAALRHGLERFLTGGTRHVEVFVAVD